MSISRDLERYDAVSVVGCFRAMYSHPALLGIIWYRMGHWLWLRKRNPVFFLLLTINHLFFPLIRMYSGLQLSPRTQIGPGLWVGHFGPVIIHPDVVAGSHLTILHGTTIGHSDSGVPRLGDHVSIGTGAIIFGNITIGDNAQIGAGAVVVKDVEAGTTVVGSPAKPIERRETSS